MKIAHYQGKNQQTVYQHLKNVAYQAGLFGNKVGLKNTATLAGWLHDIGKYSDEFQRYIQQADENKKSNKKGPDHSTAGAVWIVEYAKPHMASLMVRITTQILAVAIMGHHGGLLDVIDEMGYSPYLRRLNKVIEDEAWKKNYSEIITAVNEELDINDINELFIRSVKEVSTLFKRIKEYTSDAQEIKYGCGLICKYLYSCLIDADRYDTATFMDGITMKELKSNEHLWQELGARFEERIRLFDDSTPINKLRKQISANCFEHGEWENGIYTLNCPTGSGKTMASLRFALKHAAKQHKDRIFYIIPYITITEQNANEIRKILGKEKDDRLEDILLELHSGMEETIEEGDSQVTAAELISERLNYPIVITTMVRFLNIFFASGTRNIRGAHQFANSIIIFDEIQTISPKCIALFNGLINFLSKVCHATIILSTATQPLLDQTPQNVPHLIMDQAMEISGCTPDIYQAFKRTQVTDIRRTGGDSKEYIGELVWNEILKGKSTLIVFNTKAAVKTLYDELIERYKEGMEEKEVQLFVLTTYLYPKHRKKRIEEIRDRLKKNELVVVISTQLIEAGVDISFKTVFRSLAGLDSIVQSGGRCNRHGENGIDQYGQVYLIQPDFENLGSLTDIKRAQEAMKKLLEAYKVHPEQFDEDLCSSIAIGSYFTEYYMLQKDEMMYRFKGSSGLKLEMYPLLADNRNIFIAAKSNGDIDESDKRIVIPHSFKTAANYFKPIDENGKSVIVEHGEGKELVAELMSSQKNEDKYRLLRKAQSYSVNLSDALFKRMGGAITTNKELGVYVLNGGYYDEVFGVTETPASMTFYNF